jgi:beta-galactosidase
MKKRKTPPTLACDDHHGAPRFPTRAVPRLRRIHEYCGPSCGTPAHASKPRSQESGFKSQHLAASLATRVPLNPEPRTSPGRVARGDLNPPLRHSSFVIRHFLILAFAATAQGAPDSIDFRSDWRFTKGDPAGAEAPNFADDAWAPVRLPHDWAITGPFNPQENGYAAKLPWKGVGWYRKHFKLDREAGDRVYLDFDGVMAFPKIYVNGKLAGEWDYGYTSFRVDATPFVNLNGDNVVAIRVDTTKHGTRWYPGAGIYRKVTLQLRAPVHLAHWATRVTTPEITDNSAKVELTSTIENHSDEPAKLLVEVQLRHPNPTLSSLAGSGTAKVAVPAGDSKDVYVSMNVKNPERWDVNDPNLYTAVVFVRRDTGDSPLDYTNIDEAWIPFGIRAFQFTADDGFHLNGRRVQLYGVNLHHDHGPLGAAFYTRAMERQLQIMKEMGVNALRTSHNAPAPEVLDLCDRMGILVWDECFDKWNETADRIEGKPTHEEHAKRHLRSLVMRDRNHPSVVLWSIGNEIPSDREGSRPERMKMMRDVVRQYDQTRPVGIGCHIPDQVAARMFDALDLTGWNYDRRYARFREAYPDKPIIYSESASALSTRGFYELPLPTEKTDYSDQNQVDSYDLNAAPWSDIADREFKLMEDDRFVAGEFVWTGFDYLGEPTPFDKVAKSSYFGIVDLVGIPKDRYWLYRSHWRPDVPTVHILPHWNWPDRVGQNVPVFVYTSGDSAELFLNGKSLGRRKKGDLPSGGLQGKAAYYESTYAYRLRWNEVKYEPGELKAVAYEGDQQVGVATMRTAGAPTSLRLSPDRTDLAATGDDLGYVLVEALDKDGNLCPLADNLVKFEVAGPADIAGVGNGNPLSLEPFQAPERKLFFGKAMLIVRTQPAAGGEIRITAKSDGLAAATVTCRSTLPEAGPPARTGAPPAN